MTVDPNGENDQLVTLARERYQHIVDKGSYRVGVSNLIDPHTPPEWFDRVKFDKSQQIAEKYYLR